MSAFKLWTTYKIYLNYVITKAVLHKQYKFEKSNKQINSWSYVMSLTLKFMNPPNLYNNKNWNREIKISLIECE
jgi:hypothetical protein